MKQISSLAAQLLQLWAFLDHQDIWYELFSRGSRGCTDCDWLQELVRSEIEFKKAIRALLAYSLIEPRQDVLTAELYPDDDSYSMHPVVHDWCRELVSHRRREWVTLAVLVVGFATPDDSEAEFWRLQRRLIPHADRCVAQKGDIVLSDEIEESSLNSAFHCMGILYMDQGKLVEAEAMFQRALEGYKKTLGSDHISTFDTINNMGLLYKKQGKLVEAEKMYRRALDGYTNIRGSDHPNTRLIARNLTRL